MAFGLTPSAAGCDDEAKAAQRAEAERIVHAVRELRDADSDSKAVQLEKLKGQPCQVPELCGLRDLCSKAYTLHQRGLAATRAAAEKLSADGGLSAAARQVALAKKTLGDARLQTRRCADEEGKVVREFKLK